MATNVKDEKDESLQTMHFYVHVSIVYEYDTYMLFCVLLIQY